MTYLVIIVQNLPVKLFRVALYHNDTCRKKPAKPAYHTNLLSANNYTDQSLPRSSHDLPGFLRNTTHKDVGSAENAICPWMDGSRATQEQLPRSNFQPVLPWTLMIFLRTTGANRFTLDCRSKYHLDINEPKTSPIMEQAAIIKSRY